MRAWSSLAALAACGACHPPQSITLPALPAPPGAASALVLVAYDEEGLTPARRVAFQAIREGETPELSFGLLAGPGARLQALVLFYRCPPGQLFPERRLTDPPLREGQDPPETRAMYGRDLLAGGEWHLLSTRPPLLQEFLVPEHRLPTACARLEPQEQAEVVVAASLPRPAASSLVFRDVLPLGPDRVLLAAWAYQGTSTVTENLLADLHVSRDPPAIEVRRLPVTGVLADPLQVPSALARAANRVWLATRDPAGTAVRVHGADPGALVFTHEATLPIRSYGAVALSATIARGQPRLLLTTDLGALYLREDEGWAPVPGAPPEDLFVPAPGYAQVEWLSPDEALILGPGDRLHDEQRQASFFRHLFRWRAADGLSEVAAGQTRRCLFFPVSIAHNPRADHVLVPVEGCLLELRGEEPRMVIWTYTSFSPRPVALGDGYLVGVGNDGGAQRYGDDDLQDDPDCYLELGKAVHRFVPLGGDLLLVFSTNGDDPAVRIRLFRVRPKPSTCAL